MFQITFFTLRQFLFYYIAKSVDEPPIFSDNILNKFMKGGDKFLTYLPFFSNFAR